MEIPQDKKLILFDGVCNLCNNTVQYIIKKDKKDKFRFSSLQSEIGMFLCKERGIDTNQVDSIVMIDPGNAYYVKSTAALQIAKELGGIYTFTATILLYLPTGLRDIVYDFIARNRYKWYGKKDQCMIPTPELKGKFLE